MPTTIKFDPFVEDINRRLEKSRKESGTLSSAPATVAPPSTANNPSPRDPSIFGAFAYDVNAADQALDQSINDMLQAQYQATEKRRTDAAKMAQIAALGNVLQTAFAPVGWIGQRGATSQVANPDSRQYITAFNEALKAQQDLGNIGMQAAQMRLNMAIRRADREYQAQQRRDDRDYAAQQRKDYRDYEEQLWNKRQDRLEAENEKARSERATRQHEQALAKVVASTTQKYQIAIANKTFSGTLDEYAKKTLPARYYEEIMGSEDPSISTAFDGINTGIVSNERPVAAPTVSGGNNSQTTQRGTNSQTTQRGTNTKPPKNNNDSLEDDFLRRGSLADTNKDGVIDKNEAKIYNSNRGEARRMTKRDRKNYERLAKERGSVIGTNGKSNSLESHNWNSK